MILRTYITASLVIACALSSKYLSRKCCMTDMVLVIAEALQKEKYCQVHSCAWLSNEMQVNGFRSLFEACLLSVAEEQLRQEGFVRVETEGVFQLPAFP